MRRGETGGGMTLTEAVAIRMRQLQGEAVNPDTMALVLETIRLQGAAKPPRVRTTGTGARKAPGRTQGGA